VDIKLSQRRRAALQFLGATQSYAGGTLQKRAAAEYDAAVPTAPEGLMERIDSVETTLQSSAAWAFDRFLTRWVAEEAYVRALPAAEEVREDLEGWAASQTPIGTLTLHPDLVGPDYWENGFHLAPGGWDGHDLTGPAIHELIFKYILTPGGVGAVQAGENLNDQRSQAIRETRESDYESIVELGAGTGRFTFAIRRRFPEAKITAVELSTTSLNYGHALASEAGYDIDWLQADAADTGLPSGSANLVAAYTLLHEVPTASNQEILHEAFRLLAPGGDLLISEVAPYNEHTAFRAVVLDWETENRGEPYWRDALTMDLPAMLTEAGFVDIEAYGLNGGVHPWVNRARKPL
jgi:ubiquinone/menaquinone biosynthesis C-methylase UbiE